MLVCFTVIGMSPTTSPTGEIHMKNIEMKVTGKKLVITIDLSKSFGTSASGKTEIIATTSGNIDVPEMENTKLGLNCYRFPDAK